ncbi:MAG: 16S rRNA (uracil(1498)-N(3))-methyltransferase [Bacteroidota bacterium]
MQLFYTTQIENTRAQLAVEERRHLNVLRKKVGDFVHLVDGKGHIFKAEIVELNKKKCSLAIRAMIRADKLPFWLHIAIAPTKNIARFEWFLEKATEIGVQEITPIFCKHSERKRIRLDRLEKILISAMKQSNRTFLPKLNEAVDFSTFLALQTTLPAFRYIAHCEQSEKVDLWSNYQAGQDVVLMIGPEGDFDPSEIEVAKANGFLAVRLGEARLRTETAGIVACHTVQLMSQMKC